MKLNLQKSTCRVLAAAVLTLSFHSAQAGLIGAEQAAAGTVGAERALVLASLDRAEVAAQLQAAGVDPLDARERIRAMSDQEVHALAQDIQAAPAGGVSNWGIAAIILVVALVWYYAIRK